MRHLVAYAVLGSVALYSMGALAEEVVDEVDPGEEQPPPPDDELEAGAPDPAGDEEDEEPSSPVPPTTDDVEEQGDPVGQAVPASLRLYRRPSLRTALLGARPRLVECFPETSVAARTVLHLRAAGGELSILRATPPLRDQEVTQCLRQLLGGIRFRHPADERSLSFRLSEVESSSETAGRGDSSRRRPSRARAPDYQRRYRAGVALSIVGALIAVTGATLFGLSMGYGGMLVAGTCGMVAGVALLVAGIVLAVRNRHVRRHRARWLALQHEQLGMGDMHRPVPAQADDSQIRVLTF